MQSVAKFVERGLQEVHGRRIVVFNHHGRVFAMDSLCSHMGYPLGMKGCVEDIEDAAGNVQSCITCPAHGRKVCPTAHRRSRCLILHCCLSLHALRSCDKVMRMPASLSPSRTSIDAGRRGRSFWCPAV